MATVTSRQPVEMIEKQYTAADVAAMPSELPSGSVQYELDNGKLITMVPPGDIHGSVEANLTALLHQVARQQRGKIRCGEVGIVLWRNPDRVVGADVAFIANESLPIKRSPEGYLETIPDLIVEVRSKNDTQDYIDRKVNDYLAAGAKQVWLADPQSKSLTIHRKDQKPERFNETDTLKMQDIIPGFEIRIADIFME